MRYLGIDYGKKRIGIAVADSEIGIAVPHGTILRQSDNQAIDEIKSLVREERIGRIVVGLPLGLDGKETKMSRAAGEFRRRLDVATGVPVEFENEIFTTRMANHEGVRKEHTDASSAAIILQSYLDKNFS